MTKRRRSENGWDEFPSNLGVGNMLTDSTKVVTVESVWLEGVPAISSEEVAEREDQPLVAGCSADVAVGKAVGLRGPEGVWANPGPPAATEVDSTDELGRVGHEPAPANRLSEGEVDISGQYPADPNWFWELLAEAGWDVW